MPPGTRLPCVMARADAVHWSSSWASWSGSRVVTSRAAKATRSCAGVAMPAWCAPSKGRTCPEVPPDVWVAPSSLHAASPPEAASAAPGADRAEPAEEAPARHPLRGRDGLSGVVHLVTFTGTWAMSAPRALTTWESCRRCAVVTVS